MAKKGDTLVYREDSYEGCLISLRARQWVYILCSVFSPPEKNPPKIKWRVLYWGEQNIPLIQYHFWLSLSLSYCDETMHFAYKSLFVHLYYLCFKSLSPYTGTSGLQTW